jgi:hypothetical protein
MENNNNAKENGGIPDSAESRQQPGGLRSILYRFIPGAKKKQIREKAGGNMNWFKEFLWNLSGHQKEVLKSTQVDQYKAEIVGSLLLMVGVFASLAWTFFFSTVIGSIWIAALCGIVAGFFILLFDRALICSLSYGNKNFWALGFRFALALLLGVFLSQPIILKLYEPDIRREATLLLDKKNQERHAELEKVYSSELQLLQLSRDRIYNTLDEKQKMVRINEDAFKKEMDGSAGTGRWGYNTVSQKKESIYLKDLEEYKTLTARSEPELKWINARIDSLNGKIAAQFNSYVQANAAEGFLIQVEALQSLLSKDETNTLRNRYILLLVILTLIELSALISKLILNTSSYSSKVDFIIQKEIRNSEIDKDILFSKLDVYKRLTLEREQKTIEEFFAKTDAVKDDKLNEITEEWAKSKDQPYKKAWMTVWERLILHDKN